MNPVSSVVPDVNSLHQFLNFSQQTPQSTTTSQFTPTLADCSQAIVTVFKSHQPNLMLLRNSLYHASIIYFETNASKTVQKCLIRELWKIIFEYTGDCPDFINTYGTQGIKQQPGHPYSIMEQAFQMNPFAQSIEKENVIKTLIAAGGDVHQPTYAIANYGITFTLKEWYLLHQTPYMIPTFLLSSTHRTPQERLVFLNHLLFVNDPKCLKEFASFSHEIVPPNKHSKKELQQYLSNDNEVLTHPSENYFSYTIDELIAYLTKHLIQRKLLLSQPMVGYDHRSIELMDNSTTICHVFFNVDVKNPDIKQVVCTLIPAFFSNMRKVLLTTTKENKVTLEIEFSYRVDESCGNPIHHFSIQIEFSCTRNEIAGIRKYSLLIPKIKQPPKEELSSCVIA